METRDFKSVLQRHLTSLVCEAWAECQSPSFVIAWRTGNAQQKEMIAWIKRNFALQGITREDFTFALCDAVAWLLSQLIWPSYITEGNAQAKSVIDGLAEMFASIPEYCQSAAEAEINLLRILEQLQRLGVELTGDDVTLKRQLTNNVPIFALPDKLVVLLTASSLRHGFLRPIFAMVAISLAALDDRERLACNGQLSIHIYRMPKSYRIVPQKDLTCRVEFPAEQRRENFHGQKIARSARDPLRSIRRQAATRARVRDVCGSVGIAESSPCHS